MTYDEALRVWCGRHRDAWVDPDIDISGPIVVVECNGDAPWSWCGEGTCQTETVYVQFGYEWDNRVRVEETTFVDLITELVAIAQEPRS